MSLTNLFYDPNRLLKSVNSLKKEMETKKNEESKAGQAVDWNEEAKNLRKKGELYWKPKSGTNKFIFLNNGVHDTGMFDGKVTQKVKFEIEVIELTGNKRYFWDVTKGITKNSLYGQISLVAKANGGSLISKMGTLIARGSGKEGAYTLMEALPFLDEEDKKVEEEKKGF